MTPIDMLKKYWGYDSFRSIQLDTINSVLSGKDTVAIASTGTGKALHKDTIIHTVNGPTTMEYIKVGDSVIGRDGKATKVIKKFNPNVKEHYLITFSSGTTIKACADHLWSISSDKGQFCNIVHKTSDMNVLLNTHKYDISIRKADAITCYPFKNISRSISEIDNIFKTNCMIDNLDIDCIPDSYTNSSFYQRMVLLTTLVSGDIFKDVGTIKSLNKSFIEKLNIIAKSLGLVTYIQTTKDLYTLRVTSKSNSGIYEHHIVDIQPIVDDPKDYYCIAVDNKDKLFLITNDFIPTHNTVLYQIPSLLIEGVTIVVSPLQALQKDQQQSLEKKSIGVGVLNSTVGVRAAKKLQEALSKDEIKLLYVSPETLFSDRFKPYYDLIKTKVKFIAVDEAHCCFRQDTRVNTEYGDVSFEFLYNMYKNNLPLPKVLSYNTSTQITEYKPITKVFNNPFSTMQTITFKDSLGSIDSTENHIFFTERGEVEAKDLKEGDVVLSLNTEKIKNQKSIVVSSKKSCNQRQASLYDLEVQDNHNYFVYTTKHNKVLVHNCSEWSDFRPLYKQLHQVDNMFTGVTKLAVTATADDVVIKDIVKNVGIKSNYNIFKGSCDRPNIEYNVFKKTKTDTRHILEVIQSFDLKEQGIVFCASKKSAEQTATYLKAMGYKAAHYHSTVKKSDKDRVQKEYTDGSIKIICATIAFGMGIDIPDIRYVIHVDAPQSFEAYSQQCGRISRIGKDAYAYLFYDYKSYALAKWLNQKSTKNPERLKVKNKKLKDFHSYCNNNICRRKALLAAFGETYSKNNCGKCDVCLKRKSFK